MKTSARWLSALLNTPVDPHHVGDVLTNGGLPTENFEPVGDDTALDVEVTSNRPDCLSHIGVAREVAALMRLPFAEPPDANPHSPNAPPASSVASVAIEAPDLCPHYSALILRGIRVGPSPKWMQDRLLASGCRPINNVVDVTNYVLFEMGQPLHAFDLRRLAGPKIIVRRARAGESLISIDGKDRKLTPDMLVIADANSPVAIAGVMGGKPTEVTDATTDVLLESARFDPLSVRKTSRALALRSDSSYRFERGLDVTLPARAARRAAQLLLEIAGGQLLAGTLEAGSDRRTPLNITLRLPRLEKVLGVAIPAHEAVAALARAGLAPVHEGGETGVVHCTVPSHRLDIAIEVDLIEEVARLVGYDRVPVRQSVSVRLKPVESWRTATEMIRAHLVAAGLFEAVTFSFVSDALAPDWTPPGCSLVRAGAMARGADAHLRPSVLPGLVEAVARNEAAGTPGARVFEIGSAFWFDPAGKLVEQRKLALAGATLRELRGSVESLLQRLDARRPVTVQPADLPGTAPGAAGNIRWGNDAIGRIGLVAKGVADKVGLRSPCATAELDLAPLLAGAVLVPQLAALPAQPAVRRDLSLVLADSTRYAQLETLIKSTAGPLLESVEYVTTYRGKGIEPGFGSVTVALSFRAPDRTLSTPEVDAAVGQVVASAREKLNATLRA